ncbi:hypothetical protein SOPP22_05370 [Shewanella sp. OPT22]|nr:hypothetical protein SOPP22_05370 [Shewanella sp. OPT22]
MASSPRLDTQAANSMPLEHSQVTTQEYEKKLGKLSVTPQSSSQHSKRQEDFFTSTPTNKHESPDTIQQYQSADSKIPKTLLEAAESRLVSSEGLHSEYKEQLQEIERAMKRVSDEYNELNTSVYATNGKSADATKIEFEVLLAYREWFIHEIESTFKNSGKLSVKERLALEWPSEVFIDCSGRFVESICLESDHKLKINDKEISRYFDEVLDKLESEINSVSDEEISECLEVDIGMEIFPEGSRLLIGKGVRSLCKLRKLEQLAEKKLAPEAESEKPNSQTAEVEVIPTESLTEITGNPIALPEKDELQAKPKESEPKCFDEYFKKISVQLTHDQSELLSIIESKVAKRIKIHSELTHDQSELLSIIESKVAKRIKIHSEFRGNLKELESPAKKIRETRGNKEKQQAYEEELREASEKVDSCMEELMSLIGLRNWLCSNFEQSSQGNSGIDSKKMPQVLPKIKFTPVEERTYFSESPKSLSAEELEELIGVSDELVSLALIESESSDQTVNADSVCLGGFPIGVQEIIFATILQSKAIELSALKQKQKEIQLNERLALQKELIKTRRERASN